MSQHQSHRLNLTYRAILATFLGLSTLSANALTLGQPSIQSEQHEPLSATIQVLGIDANNFNASLANGAVYQQMGLTQNSAIQIKFVPTSDTSGNIILSSSQPISTPFADIILNLENNGEQHIKPQTLLMPLPSKSAISPDLLTPVMVASESEVSLPVVSSVELEPVGEPLQVNMVAPPPLFAEVEGFEQNTNDPATQNSDTPTVADANTDKPTQATSPTQQETLVQSKTPDQSADDVISQDKHVIASLTPEGTNTQINILTEQITRRILSPDDTLKPADTTDNKPVVTTVANQEAQTPTDTNTQETDTQKGTATYVVQSGDNLWSIANQIAKANNLNVSDVMNALHAQNPDAFSHGKISQLKANATLVIPNYDIVPSQKAIQEAISARKTTHNTARTGQRTATHNQRRTQTGRTRTTQPLPKPQMTLVSPSQGGQATGTQSRTTQSGGGDQLVGALRSTRAQAAQNARRVNGLSHELSSATQRLQLQNQKLAELEARLKALKEQ